MRIVFDASRLLERKDQSTWPTVGRDEDGEPSLRGPHNIVRTCCEFALEERASCDVYLGSPAEVVSTMRSLAIASPGGSGLPFVTKLDTVRVCDRPGVAGDASELAERARGLGIEVSERTAHRILSGQIKPLRPVTTRLLHQAAPDEGSREVDLVRDRRGLKLSEDDADEFSRIMERSFDFIAERYYLSLAGEPKVRVSKDKVTVTFSLDKQD